MHVGVAVSEPEDIPEKEEEGAEADFMVRVGI